MTNTKELESLIKQMRDKGKLVLVNYKLTDDGRTIHDKITILNTQGIGNNPMSPIYAAETMRRWLATQGLNNDHSI